ncbi:MAG TPA: VOC family protein [Phycisphaerales bacterium]|nr:VOC family protein [Phycisphaerales bacterium]
MPRVIHFEIHASQPEKMVEFYRALFGWECTKWGGPMEYWLIKTGEPTATGINGGLMMRRGAKPTDGQAVNAFVCTVDVVNVDESVRKATSLGAAIALPKMAIPGVGWLAYIKDPDGNILGMMQNDPKAS